ncbi:MAG TPA: homoserine kinase, partial [Jatrophihabitans sp.]|nr:homoserine kinase [Jatrophihabitans sp.]
MRFADRPVRVRVPATSANLGPGYDSFGLALARHDEVTASVTGGGLTIELAGEQTEQVPLDESHLVVRSMRACFELLGGQPPGLRLHCVNRIPHGRGLGSSAAAIVAGVELARGLCPDDRLEDDGALALASRLEGHPDNVAACLLGGLTVAWLDEGGTARATRLAPTGVRPVLFIPPDRSATAAARAALPATVPHPDAAFNAARAALLPLALTGRPELLLAATEDRLHQGYRAAGMPASARLVEQLRSEGIAAVISGAGPTVLALAVADQAGRAAARCPAGWECAELPPSTGAQ